MKNLNIGSNVNISIGDDINTMGVVDDVLEISENDNIYVVKTDMGMFHMNSNGCLIF